MKKSIKRIAFATATILCLSSLGACKKEEKKESQTEIKSPLQPSTTATEVQTPAKEPISKIAPEIELTEVDFTNPAMYIACNDGNSLIDLAKDIKNGYYDNQIISIQGFSIIDGNSDYITHINQAGQYEGLEMVFVGSQAEAPSIYDKCVITVTGVVKDKVFYVPNENVTIIEDYSDDELINYAKNYYAYHNDGYKPSNAEVTNSKVTANIHLYDDMGDHTATATWYYINNKTLVGTDVLENPVALTRTSFNPYVKQRAEMKKEGEDLGVVFLGQSIQNFFEGVGTVTDFDYVKFIPNSHIVEATGDETYLIIPANLDDTVEIYSNDNEKLIYSGGGEPVVLRCNVSDIMPNTTVVLKHSDGTSTRWSPSISGKDGSVVLSNSENFKIHDYTR